MNEQAISLRQKWVILTLVFIFLILIVLPVILTFFIRVIPGGIQPPLTTTKKVYQEYVYYQRFISPEDNLTGIGVSIKNPNFINKQALIVNLYDDKDKLIREIFLNGQNIGDGKFVKIIFEPIKYSQGKIFTWSVVSSRSTVEDAMEIFLTDQKPKWSLELKTKDEVFDRGFSYITLHKPGSSMEVLNRVLIKWSSNLLADRAFLFWWMLLIMVLSGLIAKSLQQKQKNSDKI